jgi:beta-alanine degradation protein BauB
MKSYAWCLIVCFSALSSSVAGTQSPADIDPLVASPANFKMLPENERVRVLEYTLQPGEHDQWHTHPPKVSYVVSGGELRIHLDDGTSLVSDEKAGTAVWMKAVPRHYAENVGRTPVRIVLVEVKGT